MLALPSHSETAQPSDDEVGQILTHRDKQAEPPIGHHRAAFFEHSTQSSTCTTSWRHQDAGFHTKSLKLLRKAIEVGGYACRTNSGDTHPSAAQFLGESLGEALHVSLTPTIGGKSGKRHPHRVGRHIEQIASSLLSHIIGIQTADEG